MITTTCRILWMPVKGDAAPPPCGTTAHAVAAAPRSAKTKATRRTPRTYDPIVELALRLRYRSVVT